MSTKIRLAIATAACAVVAGTVAAPAMAATTEGTITRSGVVTTTGIHKEAELSGLTRAAGETLVVNDKTGKNAAGKADVATAVLSLPSGVNDRAQAQPLTQLPDLDVQKLEGITTSPDGKTVFAISAFDRATPSFNVLMAWPAGDPSAAQVVGGDAVSSQKLRAGIDKALGSPGFFKIEAVTATDSQLLLGVREIGPDYKSAAYTVTILAVDYRVAADGTVKLGDAVTKEWTMSAAQSKDLPKAPIGLSDLALSADGRSLVMTTSYETSAQTPDAVAGYLWQLDLSALRSGVDATLVRTEAGKPLTFTHKAEGVLPEGGSVIVLHDDDKRATTVTTEGTERVRTMDEAPFDVVTMR
ncbi:MAG: hypothetical protein U0R64_06620 [Candidatus Nanopelagicales bacterium]